MTGFGIRNTGSLVYAPLMLTVNYTQNDGECCSGKG
jgi:hypothetical protein